MHTHRIRWAWYSTPTETASGQYPEERRGAGVPRSSREPPSNAKQAADPLSLWDKVGGEGSLTARGATDKHTGNAWAVVWVDWRNPFFWRESRIYRTSGYFHWRIFRLQIFHVVEISSPDFSYRSTYVIQNISLLSEKIIKENLSTAKIFWSTVSACT